MTPERFHFLEPIVVAALDRGEASRAGFLEAVCGGDPALRRDVEALISADGEAGSFLEVPARPARNSGSFERPEATPRAGDSEPRTLGSSGLARRPDRFGPYRILKVLGKGGMGSVFLAEQTEPIRRRVALKLIRSALVEREARWRFEAERQALARMNHANIAQAFDAGTTEEGQPYFVMEYVPGLPITAYCDRCRLDVDRRLALFVAVCDGVQHAHQKGVIHRDLKPSNILVTEDQDRPIPKIIDFGIAKALDQPLTGGTVFTGSRLIGTPAYLSPEAVQICAEGGLDLDTRADVYSLGILLHDLLVGTLPFGEPGESLVQLVRRISEVEPGKPSDRLAALGERVDKIARRRRTEPSALRHRLRGDLDSICLKAIAKERSRRYGSAAELAADVGRHLRHEPVVARPPSTAYRLGKFVRRYRVRVALALLAGIALVAGVVGVSREAERANREAAAARQVADFLVDLFQVSDPFKRGYGGEPRAEREARAEELSARQILDQGAAKIRRELRDQPLVQARLMDTIGRVYLGLGLYEQAQPLLEEGLEIRETHLGAEHLDTAESLDNLADVLDHRSDRVRAAVLYQRALRIREKKLGANHLKVADSLDRLARIHNFKSEYDRARSLVERALRIKRIALGPAHADVAVILGNLADFHFRSGQCELAMPLIEQALGIQRQRLGNEHPDVAENLGLLALCHYRLGEYELAETLQTEALEILVNTVGSDHYLVAWSLNSLGLLYLDTGDHQRASEFFLRAIDLTKDALGPQDSNLIFGYRNIARLYHVLGDDDQAELFFLRSLEIAEEYLRVDHPLVAKILDGLAGLYTDLGRFQEAEDLYRRALSSIGRWLSEMPDHREARRRSASLHLGLGELHQRLGRVDRAAEAWTRALETIEPLTATSGLVASIDIHVRALFRLGRIEEARPMAENLLAKGWSHPDFLALCREHGLLPPGSDRSPAGPGDPRRR